MCHLLIEAEKHFISAVFLLTTVQEASLPRATSKSEAKELVRNNQKTLQHFPSTTIMLQHRVWDWQGQGGEEKIILKLLLGCKEFYN